MNTISGSSSAGDFKINRLNPGSPAKLPGTSIPGKPGAYVDAYGIVHTPIGSKLPGITTTTSGSSAGNSGWGYQNMPNYSTAVTSQYSTINVFNKTLETQIIIHGYTNIKDLARHIHQGLVTTSMIILMLNTKKVYWLTGISQGSMVTTGKAGVEFIVRLDEVAEIVENMNDAVVIDTVKLIFSDYDNPVLISEADQQKANSLRPDEEAEDIYKTFEENLRTNTENQEHDSSKDNHSEDLSRSFEEFKDPLDH